MKKEDLITVLTTLLKDESISPSKVLAMHQGASLQSRLSHIRQKIANDVESVSDSGNWNHVVYEDHMRALEPYLELASNEHGEMTFRISREVTEAVSAEITGDIKGSDSVFCDEWFEKADKIMADGLCSWAKHDKLITARVLKDLKEELEGEAEELEKYGHENSHRLSIESLGSWIEEKV